jgi:hypothetical protein
LSDHAFTIERRRFTQISRSIINVPSSESAADTPEGAMSAQNEKAVVRIDLTPEQQDKIRAATGKNVEAIQMSADELEQRIAPSLTGNHNETFLIA